MGSDCEGAGSDDGGSCDGAGAGSDGSAVKAGEVAGSDDGCTDTDGVGKMLMEETEETTIGSIERTCKYRVCQCVFSSVLTKSHIH